MSRKFHLLYFSNRVYTIDRIILKKFRIKALQTYKGMIIYAWKERSH